MKFIFINMILLFALNIQAQMNAILFVDEEFQEANASSFVSNFGDISCERNVDDILNEWYDGAFMTFRKKSNIGFTQVCYWMQFQLMNNTDEEKQLFIEIPNPDLEGIEFYIFNSNIEQLKKTVTGSKYPFSKREVEHRNYLFKLKAEPLETYAIFIRVDQQPNFVNVPIKVWDENYKMEISQKGDYRFGVFSGIMLLYLFVMTIISAFLKDKYYLYYTFLLGLGFLFIFLNEGFAYQYIIPNKPALRNVFRFMILNAYLLVSLVFLENYIRGKVSSKWILRTLEIAIGFLLLVTLLIIFFPTASMVIQYVISITLSVLVIITNLLIYTLLVLIYVKDKESNILSLISAYTVAFGIAIFFTLIKFGWVPIIIDSSSAIYIGIAVIGILFTILFSYKVWEVIKKNKLLRKELSIAGIRSSFALLEGQEKERKRVADELHDGIGIKMSALKMKLSTLTKEDNQVDVIINHVDKSCNTIRSLSHSLVPRNLERYGLSVAIHDLIKSLKKESKTKIIFRQRRLAENIDPVSKLALYRLIEGILVELSSRKVEQITFKMVIIPSIQQASINLNYIGRRVEFGVNRNLANVRSIIRVLNGQVRWTMDTMWSNQLDIEIPVVELEEEELEV